MEKRYCKKCGRPLDRGDIDLCRGCVEDNGQTYEEYREEHKTEEYYTTNNVAGTIKGLAVISAILGIIASIIIGFSIDSFVTGLIGCVIAVLSVLLLYAIGEGLQILDDMKTNTEHIRDYIESENKNGKEN